ncbi:MAG: hypothetical protein V3S72_00415, partial [Desulfobacterales bacterium]
MLINLYKTRQYYHHKDFHKSPHSHQKSGVAGGGKKIIAREIKVVRKILDVNDTIAQQNRKMFSKKGVFVLNVMSSPGSGKTAILEKTLS